MSVSRRWDLCFCSRLQVKWTYCITCYLLNDQCPSSCLVNTVAKKN